MLTMERLVKLVVRLVLPLACSSLHAEIDFSLKATGQVNGVVARGLAVNQSTAPAGSAGGLFVIEGSDAVQSLLVQMQPLSLAVGERRQVELTGYCLEAHKQVPRADTPVGGPSQWRPARIMTSAQARQAVPSGSELSAALVPGTSVSVDPRTPMSSQVRADLFATVFQRVSEALDNPSVVGEIRTPYPRGSAKERRVIMQQILWRYGGTIDDEPYTEAEFEKKMKAAKEKAMPNAPDKDAELQAGVADIWASVSLVGAEAKVLREVPVS